MRPEELEKITTVLMMMMEDAEIPIDSKSRMRTYIYHAFNDDRIKFFQKEGKQVGFMIWESYKNEKGTEVYVSQCLILPEFKGFNLKEAITFLKNKYKDCYKLHWHSHRRNKKVERVGHLNLA